MDPQNMDFDQRYRAVQSRDPRFDGWFVTAVTTTGIYCRPSCPAVTPRPGNVRFYPTAAAAQRAGFRACMRCRPDATPGSPEWDRRADVVARAMRLIFDGVVDRGGVAGLAAELGYSQRQLQRLLVAEVGAGAQALARAQRAQTARILMEGTDLRAAEVAFASGFASVRQFNDTVRQVFAMTPLELRRRSSGSPRSGGQVTGSTVGVPLRLACRRPFDPNSVFAFLALRCVPGVEAFVEGAYWRTLRLPFGDGVVKLAPGTDSVAGTFWLEDLRDLAAAVSRCRRLLDLNADPVAIDEVLGSDPLLGSLVRNKPGRRVPGTVDPAELATRAVIGQQVSVAGARTIAGRLVALAGRPLHSSGSAGPAPFPVTHVFPSAEEVAAIDPEDLPMPDTRKRALLALSSRLARGELVIGPGTERADLEARLGDIPGVGPWTTAYVSMRGLGDPDAFLPGDLGVRRALRRFGEAATPVAVARVSERWRPWRAYATAHLWASEEGASAA